MLENQKIFVVGACGLIGSRIVELALQNNASVIAADVDANKLQKIKSEYNSVSLTVMEIDINNVDSVKKALMKADEVFQGRIDSLINVAYPRNQNYGRDFFEVEYDDFCENMIINTAGMFLLSQQFAKYFKQQGHGNIVNFGSIYGVRAPDFSIYENTKMTMPVEYAAIKSSIIHITKFMAALLKKNSIRVNCISPGGVLDGQTDDFLIKYNAKCGNIGMLQKYHLDSTLLYLLSENSLAVTGQNIVVDDGFTL